MRGLSDKAVLVSGGSSGIGKATVRRFLEEGGRVYFCGLDADEVRATIGELSSLGPVDGIACDVSDEDDVVRLVESAETALGSIDVLINNAGIAHKDAFLEMDVAEWDRILRVNMRGMFLVAQAVARRMVDTRQRHHREHGVHERARRRGALRALQRVERRRAPAHPNDGRGARRRGIRVNCLCPGFIRTPLNDAISDEAYIADYEREKIPLGRAGTPEEVAAAYAFLASDDASFIHGEALVIDGGQTAVM